MPRILWLSLTCPYLAVATLELIDDKELNRNLTEVNTTKFSDPQPVLSNVTDVYVFNSHSASVTARYMYYM